MKRRTILAAAAGLSTLAVLPTRAASSWPAIDVFKIYVLGGSGFCFTPAYWMLLPAYGVMWFAGRFVAGRFGERLSALLPAAVLLLLATLVSELFSSGGFYFLGGRFADPSLAEFMPRLQRYFPGTLLATLLWSGVGAAAYVAVLVARPDLRRAKAKCWLGTSGCRSIPTCADG